MSSQSLQQQSETTPQPRDMRPAVRGLASCAVSLIVKMCLGNRLLSSTWDLCFPNIHTLNTSVAICVTFVAKTAGFGDSSRLPSTTLKVHSSSRDSPLHDQFSSGSLSSSSVHHSLCGVRLSHERESK